MESGHNTIFKVAALHYQQQGLRIFPLVPGTKKPMAKGSNGYKAMINAKARFLTYQEVDELWNMYPEANIGHFPGAHSGVSIIDVDTKRKANGFQTLKDAGVSHVKDVGLKVVTPSGACHLYFGYTNLLPETLKRDSLGLEVFNCTKRYVLLPPSDVWDDGEFKNYYFSDYNSQDFDKSLLPEFPETDYFIQLASKKRNSRKEDIQETKPPTIGKPKQVFEIPGPQRRIVAVFDGFLYPLDQSKSYPLSMSDKRWFKRHRLQVVRLNRNTVIAKWKPRKFKKPAWFRLALDKPEQLGG